MNVRDLFNDTPSGLGFSLRREEVSEYFRIDGETRVITPPTDFKNFGVESDENSKRVWFEAPRIVGDEIDLSTLNLYVNYKNANGEVDKYYADDVEVVDDKIYFSWKLERKPVRYKGTLTFIVCAVATDSKGVIQTEWNTTLCTGQVLEGLEVETPEIPVEESDIINQLIDLVKETSSKAVADVEAAKAEALEAIENADGTLFANALKATASGDTIRVDDVSPLEHTARAKVNWIDPSTVTLTRCGKNLLYSRTAHSETVEGVTFAFDEDGKCTIKGTNKSSGWISAYAKQAASDFYIPKGTTVTISGVDSADSTCAIRMFTNTTIGNTLGGLQGDFYKSTTITLTEDTLIKEVLIRVAPNATINNAVVAPMLEIGTSAREYEKYVSAATFTPEADGTVNIPSLSPTMTLLTDTAGVNIDLEYNQDTNKAVEGVKEDIRELDRVTAENVAQTDKNSRELGELSGAKIVNSASGSLLALPDSSEQPFKSMKVFGKTKQFSTTGKNLLPFPFDLSALQTAGVTFTDNGNGSITASGTSTAVANLQLSKKVVFEGGKTYQLVSGSPTAIMLLTYRENGSTKYNETGKITWQATYEFVSLGLKYASGQTLNETTYPIIVEGSTYDGNWEPYTGGMPSPNPNYPQALESVGDSGSVEQVVRGKNLLPYPYAGKTKTTNGITFTDNGDGTVTANGTATENAYFSLTETSKGVIFNAKAGVQYVLRGCPDGGSSSYMVYSQALGAQDYGYGSISTILTEDRSINVAICIYKGVTVSNLTFKPMICLASITDDTYEPPNHQSLTIPTPNGLPGVPVSSGGNYTDENGQQWICDEVDFEREVYVQRVGEWKYTGGDVAINTCTIYSTGDVIYYNVKVPGVKGNPSGFEVMSSHFSRGRSVYVYPGFIMTSTANDHLYMSLKASDFGFVYGDGRGSEYKPTITNWMQTTFSEDNPLIAYYELLEPIETPLSAEEIKAYKALHTNYPSTTIYNNDGAGIEVEYVADTKNYIDNKIAQLVTSSEV